MNALFANSLQIPVPHPHLPVPFCRGNLPALDENGIKKNIYRWMKNYVYRWKCRYLDRDGSKYSTDGWTVDQFSKTICLDGLMDGWMNIGTRYKFKQCLTGWHPQDRINTWLEIYLALDENGIVKQHLQIWMNVYSTCLVSISRPGWF